MPSNPLNRRRIEVSWLEVDWNIFTIFQVNSAQYAFCLLSIRLVSWLETNSPRGGLGGLLDRSIRLASPLRYCCPIDWSCTRYISLRHQHQIWNCLSSLNNSYHYDWIENPLNTSAFVTQFNSASNQLSVTRWIEIFPTRWIFFSPIHLKSTQLNTPSV